MHSWKSPIFQKIFVINLLIILTLFASTYLVSHTILPEVSRQKAKALTDETVKGMDEQAKALFNELQEMVDAVRIEKRTAYGTPAEADILLNELVRDSPLIDGGAILTSTGELLSFYQDSDLFLLRDTGLTRSLPYLKALQTKEASFSDVLTFDISHYAMFLIIPVLDDNLVISRVVTLHIYIDDNVFFQSLFQSSRHMESASVSIVDRNGIVLSHPDKRRIGEDARKDEVVAKLIGNSSGYSGKTSLFGETVYASYSYVKEWQWGIVASVSEQDIAESAEALDKILLPLFLLVILPVSVVTVLYANHLIRPIRRLQRLVDHVAKGNFSMKIETWDNSELGHLSRRFNEMIDSLQHAREEIRGKEAQLKEQHTFLRTIMDLNPNYIYAKDRYGTYVMVNHPFARLLGMDPRALTGRNEAEFRTPEEYERLKEEDFSLLDHPEGKMILEEPFTAPDGSVRWLQTAKLPLAGTGDRPDMILCVSTDITERRKTEELLRTSEKLSMAGELAAGVAHEIRNPLTSLRGFVQLLQRKGEESHQKYLDIMLSEMDRINDIVNEFLLLSKPQAVTFQRRPLAGIMEQVMFLLESQANLNNVTIEMDNGSDPLYIHCEENQIKQVFINLMKNGIESMPNGGRIRIETRLAGNGFIRIRFQDEGSGLSQELLQKLGQPFYTTKEKGTGLGLMVSFKIIETHRGTISFQSELGRGTTIDVMLPQALIEL